MDSKKLRIETIKQQGEDNKRARHEKKAANLAQEKEVVDSNYEGYGIPADEQDRLRALDKREAARIQQGKEKRYDPMEEYHTRPDSKQGKEMVGRGKEQYEKFKSLLHENGIALDLSKPQTIRDAYEVMEKNGFQQEAQSLREGFFGKDMHFYGVVYSCDFCHNNCAYCPFAAKTREGKQNMKKIKEVENKKKEDPGY